MDSNIFDRIDIELRAINGVISVGITDTADLVRVQVTASHTTPADRLKVRRIVRAHIRQPVVVETLLLL